MSTSLNGLQSLVYLIQLLGGYGGLTTSSNIETSTLTDAIKSAGSNNKTTEEDIEDQLSIFETQEAIYTAFASISTFSAYVTPLLTNVQEQISALELVLDNFEAFSGGDGVISKADRADIEEAAEEDDNEDDFSEDDLEALYDMHDMDYEAEVDFVYDDMDFDSKVSSKSGDQEYEFDDDYSDENILVKDNRGYDEYTVTEDIEDANIVFTKLKDHDTLNLEGAWSVQEIEDAETEEEYVLYTNEDTGTNVYVKGTLEDVGDLVTTTAMEDSEESAEYLSTNFDTLKGIAGYSDNISPEDFEYILEHEDEFSDEEVELAQKMVDNENIIKLADYSFNYTGDTAHNLLLSSGACDAVEGWYENSNDVNMALSYLDNNFEEIDEDGNGEISYEELEDIDDDEIKDILFNSYGDSKCGQIAFGLANASDSNIGNKSDLDDPTKGFKITEEGLEEFKNLFAGTN